MLLFLTTNDMAALTSRANQQYGMPRGLALHCSNYIQAGIHFHELIKRERFYLQQKTYLFSQQVNGLLIQAFFILSVSNKDGTEFVIV